MIDTETTGILPGFHHRVAEIAVVHLDRDGVVTGSWDTLVNPQRDLGPQALHGIRAADARRAPRFADIAADVVDLAPAAWLSRTTGRSTPCISVPSSSESV